MQGNISGGEPDAFQGSLTAIIDFLTEEPLRSMSGIPGFLRTQL